MIKFSEMKYERLDLKDLKAGAEAVINRLAGAPDYQEARAACMEHEEARRHTGTMMELAQIRHDIDTRDEYYDAENKFWQQAGPELEAYEQRFMKALLDSPFRPDFEKEFGRLIFLNTEIALKTFSPAIIPDMQQENKLAQEYEDLLASAQVPFEDGKYTLSQMTPFMNDPDDNRRLAAWKATGSWYKENQPELDRLYDELTHLRDGMGKKLGYEGYTTLGYYRMGRNCYDRSDIGQFREAVRKYVVPVAAEVYRRQAERLGKEYPLSFADAALSFRSGNPKPEGSADDIVAAGSKFYDELSPETGEFFRTMTGGELMDLLSKPGKAGGGYCTSLSDYKVPFIFANFNGTQGDVEVITHEAGHAFAAWMNRERVPSEYIWPSMEACEVHSMSMEFFGEKWAADFFGKDARKYLYSHLAGALTFIPYGTMVDHFQHTVYEKPGLTPRERHDEWKRLMGIYTPWLRLDGGIPFFADGEHWQRQHHIYSSPFYYIDYCLAQTVSLEFWSMLQDDMKTAWKYYMAYTVQGGSETFTDLLKNAGLASPFDQNTLRGICEKAGRFLADFDLSGIE